MESGDNKQQQHCGREWEAEARNQLEGNSYHFCLRELNHDGLHECPCGATRARSIGDGTMKEVA